VVECGGPSCSIAAGEFCCEGSPLYCSTTSCGGGFHEYDCDGPEDCPSGVCCFDGNVSACTVHCQVAAMCHTIADCPKGQICCLNFVLGPGDGLCLGACD